MADAIQVLLAECEQRGSEKGVLRIRDNDSKRWGSFYIYKGRVYYATLDGVTLPYRTRITKTQRAADEEALNRAISMVKDESDPKLPFVLLQRQLLDDANLQDILKDYFFDISSTILSWTNVRSKWTRHKVDVTDVVVEIEGGKLVENVNRRSSNIHTMANGLGVSLEDLLESVTVVANPDQTDLNLKPDEKCVLGRLQKQSSYITQLKQAFGLTTYSALRAVYRLWLEERIELFMENQNLRPSEEEVEEEILYPESPIVNESADDIEQEEQPDEGPRFMATVTDPLGLEDYGNFDYSPKDNNSFGIGDTTEPEEELAEREPEPQNHPLAALPPRPGSAAITAQYEESAHDTETESPAEYDLDGLDELDSSLANFSAPEAPVNEPEKYEETLVESSPDEITEFVAAEEMTPEQETGNEITVDTASPVENTNLTSLLAQLQDVVQQINAQKSTVQSQIDSVTNNLREVDKEVTDIREEDERIEEEKRDLLRRKQENDDRKNSINSRRDSLLSEKDNLEKSLRELQEAADSVNLR